MPKSKRKRDSSLVESQKRRPQTCILHVTGIDHGPFTSLKSVKGDPNDKLIQLRKIRDQRQAEPPESTHRMDSVCCLIPDSIEGLDLDFYGYHRQCYQRFHLNLNRLKAYKVSDQSAPKKHHSPRKPSSSKGTEMITSPLFPQDCIFCDKVEKKVHGKTERPGKFTSWRHKDSSWEQIEHQALALGHTSLYRKVQGKDLHATEAQCHPYCHDKFHTEYHNYIRGMERADAKVMNTAQACQAAAHREAFNAAVEMLTHQVIEKNEVIQLSSLRRIYIEKLAENGCPNPEYRSEKLLHRLQNHELSKNVSFTKASPGDKGCLSFILIYSNRITVVDAVAFAYKLGARDKFTDVALFIRGLIQRAYKESKELPWPPTLDDLEIKSDEMLPRELVKFLTQVIVGISEIKGNNEKIQRLVLSIGQDLCRAVTHGEWKLPKHILLCTTIQHMFRSKQLSIILNRLGHSESYEFGLELETAMTKAIDEMSTYLTPQIISGEGNLIFHCEWDNLNKILTNIHGSNVVNSAGGIMIQETNPGFERLRGRTLPQYERSKDVRSYKVDTPETLPEVTIYTRVGPKFPKEASFSSCEENDKIYDSSMQEYYAWLICRMVGSDGKQLVPAFGGFISATGSVPLKKSTIDYFTPINQPITEYSTVQELLRRSEIATAEVVGGANGQQYVINTFDLGVCMKALPLIWKFPEKYKQHIILPGPFHTTMNYMGMITGHKCRGSGYSEILLEAQLVTSGCIKSVLSGKAYAKAIFCLRTVCEAMERLIMEQFISEESMQVNNPVAILNLVKGCNRENLDLALKDSSTQDLIKRYQDYEDKVRTGYLGKTAMFWFSFIEHCHLVFMLQYAVKTNNFELFHKCNGEMADLFFAYDGQNYSR